MTDGEALESLYARGFWDAREQSARYIMERVGYQHLRPYLAAAEQVSPEHGHTVKSAHDMMTFDRLFKSRLFAHIGSFECQMRARYAAAMAEAHGPAALYDPGLFLRPENYERSLASLESEVGAKATRSRPVREALEAGGGRLPTWLAVECMTLGTLCKLYANTADRGVTGAVATSFGATKDELANWSKTITQVRNLCAHLEPYLVRRQIPSTPRRIAGCPCRPGQPLFIVALLSHLLGAGEAGAEQVGLDYGRRVIDDAAWIINDYERFCGGVVPIPGFPLNWRELIGVVGR